MSQRLSLIAVVVGIAAIIATILASFFYFTQSNSTTSASTLPTLSSIDVLNIVQDNVERWNSAEEKKFHINYKITDIATNPPKILNDTINYMPTEKFNEKNMKLPLIYISPNNRTVFRILERMAVAKILVNAIPV